MIAAIVKGNCLVEIAEIAEPSIAKPTEIKIRVISGAICNTTDNKIYATDHPEKNWPFKSFPFVLGHECSGVIVEAGEEVNELKVGDRVVYWTVEGGAFAEYLILDTADSTVSKINDAVEDDTAAMMEMVIGSARLLFSANGEQYINQDSTVLVIGLGPAGLIYTRLALLMNARRVVCAGRGELRINTAKSLGADAVIDVNAEGYLDHLHESLEGGADIIIDATGGDVVSLMTAMGKKGARVIPYGITPFDWNDRLSELTKAGLLSPDFSGHETARHAIRWCVEKAEAGLLGLSSIISHRLPLDQVGRGLDLCRLEKDKTLKVIIQISEF
ncbi:zinc-binding dehydrogenase [Paenibacillus sp. NPDC058174]|uniref:zinc-dependent alcohol dehydrogenase n=1 Tax=Paenibacillus sp. NPDC058174 TaxID=3346366 RepID=UPI0036D900F8